MEKVIKDLEDKDRIIEEELFEHDLLLHDTKVRFPIPSSKIGHRITSKREHLESSPLLLQTNISTNICKLTIPHVGVWLINYELNIANLARNDTSDAISNLSYAFMSVSLGDTDITQSFSQIVYLVDTKLNVLQIGENIMLRGSEVYTAESEMVLSLNIQFIFTNRLFVAHTGNRNVCDYNLSATRIA